MNTLISDIFGLRGHNTRIKIVSHKVCHDIDLTMMLAAVCVRVLWRKRPSMGSRGESVGMPARAARSTGLALPFPRRALRPRLLTPEQLSVVGVDEAFRSLCGCRARVQSRGHLRAHPALGRACDPNCGATDCSRSRGRRRRGGRGRRARRSRRGRAKTRAWSRTL